MKKMQMRFAGSGGQGMMLVGDLMAHLLGVHKDNEVILLKSYGPEARGGACRSELLVSKERIDYPVLTVPDLFLALSQTAYDSYIEDVDQDSLIVVDSELVFFDRNRARTIALPISRCARQATGKNVCANITAMAVICRIMDLCDEEELEVLLKEKLSAKILDMNIEAAKAGWKLAEEAI